MNGLTTQPDSTGHLIPRPITRIACAAVTRQDEPCRLWAEWRSTETDKTYCHIHRFYEWSGRR